MQIPQRIKIILLLSLALNTVFMYKVAKDRYGRRLQSHPSDQVTYLYNRQTIYKVLPVNKDDVVFLGDSHIQKFDLPEFFQDLHIKNRGIDGDVTAGVLNRLDDVTKGHPRKIFLEVGINDIFLSKDVVKSIPTYKQIVKTILKDSPESKLYIQSIFPSKLANQDTVLKYNRLLKQICEENGLTFIDAYPKFNTGGVLNPAYDCGDFIHLNGSGYSLWSQVLKPYL